jgi:hypothetical protein
MRSHQSRRDEIDALDLAAIWPCCAQIAGPPLPPMEACGTPERARRDEVDHGIW